MVIFLSQPIWCNNSFVKQGKPLYFEEWLKSGIFYVKELLDDEVDFLSLASACRKIKSNVLGEIYILKNIFSKLCKNFDCTKAKYVNVDRNATYFFLANNRICDFSDVNSKLFFTKFCYHKRL